MKKILLFLVIGLLISCEEKKIEVIPDLDDLYVENWNVDSAAVLLDKPGGVPVKTSLIKYLEDNNFYKEYEPQSTKIFNYKLFINEKGKIDRVMIEDGMGDKFDEYLIKDMESWSFKPAIKNGKPQKVQLDWGFSYYFSEKENRSNPQESDSVKAVIDDVYFVAVEEMPQPIGGIQEIAKKVVYPEVAKRAGIQGKVYVKAFIDENGNVIRAEILKGIGAGCDEAAIKAIEQTKFTPGKQRGIPVKVQVSIPVLFKLK